jgi:VIT1/CCC1 family predicted Fe2+/Mn2+ transporter
MVGRAVRRWILDHLVTRQVARVIYGAIIGMALIVVLEDHPPPPGRVVGELVATAVAVSLAELYSEIVAAEGRARRRLTREEWIEIIEVALGVAFGIVFPAIFFVLAAAGVMDVETAFTIAKWSGVGLIAFYGFTGARLIGIGIAGALLQGFAVGAIGVVLILLKSLVH